MNSFIAMLKSGLRKRCTVSQPIVIIATYLSLVGYQRPLVGQLVTPVLLLALLWQKSSAAPELNIPILSAGQRIMQSFAFSIVGSVFCAIWIFLACSRLGLDSL